MYGRPRQLCADCLEVIKDKEDTVPKLVSYNDSPHDHTIPDVTGPVVLIACGMAWLGSKLLPHSARSAAGPHDDEQA